MSALLDNETVYAHAPGDQRHRKIAITELAAGAFGLTLIHLDDCPELGSVLTLPTMPSSPDRMPVGDLCTGCHRTETCAALPDRTE